MKLPFRRRGTFHSKLVKLPRFCTPNHEAEELRVKRDARLQWMREHGIRYLGNPPRLPDRRAPVAPAALSRAAIERPGDAIARDLAGNSI